MGKLSLVDCFGADNVVEAKIYERQMQKTSNENMRLQNWDLSNTHSFIVRPVLFLFFFASHNL